MRSAKSRVQGIYPSRNNVRDMRFGFIVRSGESYSDPHGHITSVKFPTTDLTQDFKNNRKIVPMNENVLFHCTCPAWVMWGSDYLSGQNKYNLNPATSIPALIRDPHHENWLCKHAIKVAQYIAKMGFEQLLKRFNIFKPNPDKTPAIQKSYLLRKAEDEGNPADFETVPPSAAFPIFAQILHRRGESQETIDNLRDLINEPELDEELVKLQLYVR